MTLGSTTLGGTGGGVNLTPSEVRLDSSNGYGSTNNKISKFNTATTDTGTDLTLTQSATDGDSVTVNTEGWYSITAVKDMGGPGYVWGVSVNSNQLTTDLKLITSTHRVVATVSSGSNYFNSVATTVKLSASDVIRMHTDGRTDGTNNAVAMLRVVGPL